MGSRVAVQTPQRNDNSARLHLATSIRPPNHHAYPLFPKIRIRPNYGDSALNWPMTAIQSCVLFSAQKKFHPAWHGRCGLLRLARNGELAFSDAAN
jgi:hypothetical protein